MGDRPVFVVGCPRSGTTLLTLMLHAHSRIAIPPETRFLMLASFVVDRRGTKFRDLGLDPQQVRRAVVAAPPTVGSALGSVFRCYAAAHGKPR
ncbi:MAG TPA: sulfotransferase, partial [Actinomycetes bacterium]